MKHTVTVPTLPGPEQKMPPDNLRLDGAFALLREKHGRILVTRRAEKTPRWDLPGGGVKGRWKDQAQTEYIGETPKQAVIRETSTEIGFDIVEPPKLVGVYKQIILEKKDGLPTGEVVARHTGFAHLYLCTGPSIDNLDISELDFGRGVNREVSEARFMSIDEILTIPKDEWCLGPLRMIAWHYHDEMDPHVEKDKGVYSYHTLSQPVPVWIGDKSFVI